MNTIKNKKISVIVAALVVLGIVFYGGVKYGESNAQTQTSMQSKFGGKGGQRMTRSGGINQGQVLTEDDQSITIKLQDGGSKIIFLTDSTPIMKSVPGAREDIATGTDVMVIGNQNSDGSVSAQSIQIRPAKNN